MLRKFNGTSYVDLSFYRKYYGNAWQDCTCNKFNGTAWSRIFPDQLLIYSNGKLYNNTTFGYLKNDKQYYNSTDVTNRKVEFTPYYITIHSYSWYGNNQDILSNISFDLTNYTKYHALIDYYLHDGYTQNYIGVASLALLASKESPSQRVYNFPHNSTDVVKTISAHEETKKNVEIVLDISSLTGKYYLGYYHATGNWYDTTAQSTIYKLWLT